MIRIGDRVVCRDTHPLYSVVGNEIGTVTSSYFIGATQQYISVLFAAYGAEPGGVDSIHFESLTDTPLTREDIIYLAPNYIDYEMSIIKSATDMLHMQTIMVRTALLAQGVYL